MKNQKGRSIAPNLMQQKPMLEEIPQKQRSIDLYVYKPAGKEPVKSTYLLKGPSTGVAPSLVHDLQAQGADESSSEKTLAAPTLTNALVPSDVKPLSDDELNEELKLGGYRLPNNHLETLLKWTDQNHMVAIRKPWEEDLDRLREAYVVVQAKHPGDRTLTWQRILKEAKKLAQAKRKILEFRADRWGSNGTDSSYGGILRFKDGLKVEVNAAGENISDPLEWATGCLVSAMQGFLSFSNLDESSSKKSLDTFTKFLIEGKPQEVDGWQPTLVEVLKKGESGDASQAAEQKPRPTAESSGAGSVASLKSTEIAGLIAAWRSLEIFNDNTKEVIGTVEVPIGLRLADGNILYLDIARAESKETLRQKTCTEGYHLFSIPPNDAGLTQEQMKAVRSEFHKEVKRDYAALRIYFESLKASQSAPASASGQASSDPKAKNTAKVATVPADSTPPVLSPFAQPSPHSLQIDIEAGALPGAMVIVPAGDCRYEIHLLLNQTNFDYAQEKFFKNVTNRLLESKKQVLLISFMFSQLYANDSSEYAMKINTKLDETWKHKKELGAKVGLALGAAGVVAASTALFGIPLAVAAVAAGVTGIKRIIAKEISDPSDALKNPNFLFTSEAAEERILFDEEDVATDPLSKDDSVTLDSAADRVTNDELRDKDVGILITRAYVHFDAARSKLKKVLNNEPTDKQIFAYSTSLYSPLYPYPKAQPEDKLRRLGKALHHLEKGWRYLGPAVLFLQAASEGYHKAQRSFDEKIAPSPQLSLIEKYQVLLKQGRLPTEPDKQKKDLTELLASGRLAQAGYQFAKAKSSMKSKFRLTVGPKPENPKKAFEKQLDALFAQLDSLSPPSSKAALSLKEGLNGASSGNDSSAVKAVPSLSLDEAAAIGGPEIFSRWRTVEGGTLEPVPLNPKITRDNQTAEQSLKALNDRVYRHVMLYRAALDSQHPPSDILVGEADDHLVKLSQLMLSQEQIAKAWREGEAVQWVGKRLNHRMRNWYRSTTPGTKATNALGTTIEIGGAFATPLFQDLFGVFNVKGDGKWFAPDADKIEQGLIKGSISAGLAAVNLAVEQGGESLVGAALKDKAESKGLPMAGGLATASADAIIKIKEAIGFENSFSRGGKDDVLKGGAAFVGSSLIRGIGFRFYRASAYQKRFIDLSNKVPPEKESGWNILKEHIQPLASYYSEMNRLSMDLLVCLAYIDGLSLAGQMIEKEVLKIITELD
jgi:hypothetical protein